MRPLLLRFALPFGVLAFAFVLVLPAAAQTGAHPIAGTWYSLQDVRLTVRTGTDTTGTTVETTSNVTLNLSVDGQAVAGEERREMMFPPMPGSASKDPTTFSSALDVEGTLEGDALRLTMTADHGQVFRYEGTFDADGRRITLRVVRDEPAPGAEPVAIIYERQPPKPREVKG